LGRGDRGNARTPALVPLAGRIFRNCLLALDYADHPASSVPMTQSHDTAGHGTAQVFYPGTTAEAAG